MPMRSSAMPKTLPTSEVKARLPELVAGVEKREEGRRSGGCLC